MPQYPDVEIDVRAANRSTTALRRRVVQALRGAGYPEEALALSQAMLAAPSYFRALALCREVLTIHMVGGEHPLSPQTSAMRKGS